ncbi:MAG TPA: pilus assembly protein PilM [Vicinamibacterales bacterium]|nr:pilus assembly protein PilM [Vicinamibacterales bacterium]
MSLLASWLAAPPPDAAVEIAPEAVAVGVLGRTPGRGGATLDACAVQPLPSGAVVASMTAPNVVDREAVTGALRAACDRLGVRPRRVALVIPDLAARVSLVRFERVPARADDLEQLIRWQLKKAAPFPVEDAVVSWSPGLRGAGGSEFVAVLARRDIVRGYESACEQAGMHPGLVDLATLSLVNLFSAGPSTPAGDWLVVHMRPEYTSMVILRGEHVLFFRSRAEGDEEALPDVVHQTAMYYQDRLDGWGFSHVLLGGRGRSAGAMNVVRRSLEERLAAPVESIDPARLLSFGPHVQMNPESLPALAAIAGMLVRVWAEAAA